MSGIGKKRKIACLERYAYQCFYCNAPLSYLDSSMDHLWPRVRGSGKHLQSNIVASCKKCNWLKGHLPPLFFMKHREELIESVEIEEEFYKAKL